MKHTQLHPVVVFSSIAVVAGALLAALPGVAHGQYAQDAASPAPASAANTAPRGAAETRPLSSVVSTMSRASGAIILADSSVAGQNVPAPAEATTQANFEAQLDTLVKALPAGTTWAKVYLPVTGSASRLNADSVTDYVIAQSHLFGTVGAAAPTGTVEIMGQKVPQDKATSVISALNLKPVYIVTNPRQRTAPTAEANAASGNNWSQMTPDQRRAYAQQQAQQIMSMDPASQQQYFQQQREVMRSMMQQMTPEQRQQFFQSMGGGGGFGGGRRFRGGGGGGQ